MGIFKLLTGKEDEILKSINGFTLSGEDIAKFGDVIHDYSDQHRNSEVAKRFGFEEPPVIGVHLAAIGGRISRDLMSVMQPPDNIFFYTMQEVTFRDPVYQGEPINWTVEESVEDGLRSYKLIVPNKDPEKKPRVEMISEFKIERPIYQKRDLEKLVYTDEIEITASELKGFYNGLREEPSKEVAFSLGVGRIPSVLLSLASKFNKLEGREIGGKNLGMKSESYSDLQIGKAIVDVYFMEKKGRGNRVSYIFEGVLKQAGIERASSQIKTLTNGEFANIYALRQQVSEAA